MLNKLKRAHVNTTYSMSPVVDHLLDKLKEATGVGKSALVERIVLGYLARKPQTIDGPKIPTAQQLNRIQDAASKALADLPE